jgi:Dolichyl-phosphate-mannose-protein mannosyltransferase
MIRLVFFPLLVAYLPGALIFRLPIADRARRAALGADERVFWHVMLSVAWSGAVVLALAAAGAYRFERLLAIDGMLSALIIVGSRTSLFYRGAALRPSWTVVLPIILIALGVWRFFPSSEYIIGGKDPGSYMNEGVQIAQRGTLVVHDPLVSDLPEAGKQLFFPRGLDPNYEASRFMGLFVLSVRDGTVVGQFPHFYPASIAVAYGIDGLTGGLRVVGLWAILGVLAVYFAAARLCGRGVAFAAAALLSLHAIEVWFSRSPNAEIVLQAFVFATLLAFARAHQDGDRFFGVVAGVLAGLAVFVKIDELVVVSALVGAIAVMWLVDGKRPRAGFVVTLIAGLTLGLLYLNGPMRGYFGQPLLWTTQLSPGLIAAVVVGVAAVLTGLILLRRRFAGVVRVILPWIFATVVVFAAGYAYVMRQPGGKLTDYDALALRTFVDFHLLPLGLIAALIGTVIVWRRDFWRDPAMAIVFTGFALLFFYKIRVVPSHFWMDRRFLAVILPCALIFVAVAALGLTMTRPRGLQLVRIVGGLAFLIWLGRAYAVAAAPLLPHIEYESIIPTIERIAGTIGDRDLLIVESRDAGSDTHVFGLPLAYIYAKPVLILPSARPDKIQFETFLRDALTKYDRVLFIGGGGTDLLSRAIVATPMSDGQVHVPEYDNSPWDRYPSGVKRKDFDYSVYQLSIGGVTGAGFVLDVGDRDDLNVVRFYAKERSDGRTVRWTGRQSFVAIPGLTGAERDVALVMHDGGRPSAAGPAEVDVFFNETRLGRIAVKPGFQTYHLTIPADAASRAATMNDPTLLRLVAVSTWNPATLLGGSDTRDLGVMIDRVEVH